MLALICGLLAQGDALPEGAVARLGSNRFRSPHYLGAIAVSRDGGVIAAFESGGGVMIWDGKTGRPLHHCRPNPGPHAPPGKSGPGISISSDGRRVAAGSYDAKVRVWDSASGKESFSFDTPGGQAATVALSPDGATLAAAAGVAPPQLWALDTGKPRTADGPTVVRGAVFAPDGKTLAVGGMKEIVLLDAATGAARRRIPVDGYAGPLAYSSDGRQLAFFIGPQSVRVLETETWTERAWAKAGYGPTPSLLFSPDGKTLRFDDTFGLSSLDLASNVKTAAPEKGDFTGRFAAAPKADLLVGSHGHLVRIWKAGKPVPPESGHLWNVDAVAFSPDGRRVATACDVDLQLWDAADGRLLRKIPFPSGTLRAVAFSPDGRRIAAGGLNFDLSAWEVETGAQVWKVPEGPDGSLACIAWSPDGLRLAVGAAGKSGRVYDAKTGAALADLAGHRDSINGLAFLDAQTIVTASGDSTARVWNAKDGAPLGALEGHTSDLSSVAVSADGSRIVTAGVHMNRKSDGTIRVWEAFTGDLLRVISSEDSLAGALALSPDGRTLASSRIFRDEIQLWDLADGRPAGRLPGHVNGGYALSFSPDGSRLVSGGMDTAALVWKTPPLRGAVEPAADLEKAWDLLLTARGAELESLHEALVAAGNRAAEALLPRCRIRPPPAAEAARVDAWLAALDGEDVAARTEAVDQLRRCPWDLGARVAGKGGSPELREALATVLAYRRPQAPRFAGEPLRRRRAIAILERIGSQEAKAALRELSSSSPEAAEALQRLR